VTRTCSRWRAAPPRLDIEWRHGEAGALPFDDGAFDVVICQQRGLQCGARDRALERFESSGRLEFPMTAHLASAVR
jgi:hypothetical protein